MIFRITTAVAFLLAGCAHFEKEPLVHQPTTARPHISVEAAPANGAIYRPSDRYVGLFEDRRARAVGDTLVVVISEKTAASKASGSSAERGTDIGFSVSALKGLPGKSFLGSELEASSSLGFEGKGESAANNDFRGTIAVTVVEVLPNGNLLVSGEKQIAINQGTEFVRFSGVVNPASVTAGNTVLSTQVADARIEYRANGYIDEAQAMGWLTRFFLNVLPF